jgi:hypothetical protein
MAYEYVSKSFRSNGKQTLASASDAELFGSGLGHYALVVISVLILIIFNFDWKNL